LKTYILRIINDELFFSIAGHPLTVVDAVYVRRFTVKTITITPSQTTNVLLTTKPSYYPGATYCMLVAPYSTAASGTFDNTNVMNGAKPVVLPYGATVELVMQGTSILGAESHPLHLHGFNFFVFGQGFGKFDPAKGPSNYNLLDHVERNTVGVPTAGWVAFRFRADNPGE
jgi:FtsP/CotA-like multicopper oxidase with cupredoxin domain